MLCQQGNHQRQHTQPNPTCHDSIEADEIEPVTHRRLRCWNPFKEMPAGDEQPHQRSCDRIAHQPRLMPQERDDEHPLGEREAQIAAEGA